MWDRVQIICRQPWRKDVQIGLSFLRIRSTDGLSSTVSQTAAQTNTVDENGERKSVKDIQRHFFGKTVSAEDEKDSVLMERLQKLAGSSEGGSAHEKALPRMAHMVLAANHKSNGPAPAGHMNASELQKEVSQFLVTLDINKNDLDSVCGHRNAGQREESSKYSSVTWYLEAIFCILGFSGFSLATLP
nr:hypothetical protein BaRGS_001945 [Batillaria attramentaria]